METTIGESSMLFRLMRKFQNNKGGATAIEYGLIMALVSMVAIIALNSFCADENGNNTCTFLGEVVDLTTPSE